MIIIIIIIGDHFKYVSNLSGEAFQIEEGLEEEKIDTEFLTEKREHHATVLLFYCHFFSFSNYCYLALGFVLFFVIMIVNYFLQ